MASGKDSIRSYLGYGGFDHRQRTLDQTLTWNDALLESVHDYIQWWFPLTEQSAFNANAPVASRCEFEELRGDERVRAGVACAMHRMLRFYGLYVDVSGVVGKTDEWQRCSQNWAYSENHNDLRITRILKSLCLLGHRVHATSLHAALEKIIKEERTLNHQAPLRFWSDALL